MIFFLESTQFLFPQKLPFPEFFSQKNRVVKQHSTFWSKSRFFDQRFLSEKILATEKVRDRNWYSEIFQIYFFSKISIFETKISMNNFWSKNRLFDQKVEGRLTTRFSCEKNSGNGSIWGNRNWVLWNKKLSLFTEKNRFLSPK